MAAVVLLGANGLVLGEEETEADRLLLETNAAVGKSCCWATLAGTRSQQKGAGPVSLLLPFRLPVVSPMQSYLAKKKCCL